MITVVRQGSALTMLAAVERSEQILTTNLVAGETWTFLRRKDGHRTALAFLDRLDTLRGAQRLVVHRVTEDQEGAAWEWLRNMMSGRTPMWTQRVFVSCAIVACSKRWRSTETSPPPAS